MRVSVITAAFTAAALAVMQLPLGASAASDMYFTVTEVQSSDISTITADGEKWFKVGSFDDDKDYIITVKDKDGRQYMLTVTDGESSGTVWSYYRQTMVSSTTPRFTSLRSGSSYLVCSGDALRTAYTRSVSGDLVWEHIGSTLRYNEDGTYSYLRYDADSETPFSFTREQSEAAEVDIYTKGEQLERCIVSQPHAESYVLEGSGYAAPRFTVGLSDVEADSVKWYVDGEEQPCGSLSFTAETLADRPAGVHRVSCLVEAHDDSGIRCRERSEDALFVIAKGVVPDSFLTFSDVHEEYGLIGDAIENVIERTGGYIPSLVICTGDLVNGTKAEKDIMLERYYPRIIAELGGLDTVFVSGNHDAGGAASAMSAAADLGAGESLSSDGGQIFCGSSEAVARNGRNSRYAKGLIVYGLNQEAVMKTKDGGTVCSYEDVIGGVDAFLRDAARNYRGELVVISAHTGLHTLGIQPDSMNRNGMSISDWIGENAYNINGSYELASLINSYAERYGMDIMYLFGHDHSRSETELIMTDGSELISTVRYEDKMTGTQPLHFTYAHSGYLSTQIGSADSSFSFVYRDGGGFVYELIRTSDNRTRRTDIAAKYVAPPETTAATSSAATSTAATTTATTAVGRTDNPKTGDDMSVFFAAMPALLLLAVGTKRRRKR